MNGAESTGKKLTMTAYGATEEADAAFDPDTGKMTIACYEPSETPLSLVFKAEGGITVTRSIRLEGY